MLSEAPALTGWSCTVYQQSKARSNGPSPPWPDAKTRPSAAGWPGCEAPADAVTASWFDAWSAAVVDAKRPLSWDKPLVDKLAAPAVAASISPSCSAHNAQAPSSRHLMVFSSATAQTVE